MPKLIGNMKSNKLNIDCRNMKINVLKCGTHHIQKVFEIKKKLNILPKGLNGISSLKDFVLEKKPLLLFGDCQQNWINNNAKDINARINKVAVGAYYFGGTKYNCDVIYRTNGNRHIF